jgi:hypothetical protein
MSEVAPASGVLIIGSFFGFPPLGNFRLALLSSLRFMALSSMAAFGTLTIVSERMKCGAKPNVCCQAQAQCLLV